MSGSPFYLQDGRKLIFARCYPTLEDGYALLESTFTGPSYLTQGLNTLTDFELLSIKARVLSNVLCAGLQIGQGRETNLLIDKFKGKGAWA
jgi:hypothetical protein